MRTALRSTAKLLESSPIASSSRRAVRPALPVITLQSFRRAPSVVYESPSMRTTDRAVRSYATEIVVETPKAVGIPDIAPEDTYDIVIIGGGNAGLALACALLHKPSLRTTRVLLLEGGSLDRVRNWSGKGEWENRVSSLTADNVAWLDRIGVWQHIKQDRSCPVNEMIIWSNPSEESTPTIHFPPLGRPMARMTENTNLQHALLERIEQVGRGVVDIREGSRVAEMRLGEGDRWVGLRIGDKWVRGGVVVGADGPNSPVRHFSQIGSYGHGYDTHAVVATLLHPPSAYPNNTAFQRFLPTGPLAFLPLSPRASTMVWSTLPAHAAAYKRLTPQALTAVVNAGYTLPEDHLSQVNASILQADPTSPISLERITSMISSFPLVPPTDQILPPTISSIEGRSVASFPLRLSHADSYLGQRTILVGDAAHTIHPLAGQGLNMGLADVRSLASTWEAIRLLGGDLGQEQELGSFPRERYGANQLMLTTTDGLHRVFRARSGVVDWVRGTGLEVINELEGVKRVLMRGAGAGEEGKINGTGTTTEEAFEGRKGRKGWGVGAAKSLDGWLGFKSVVGASAGFARDGLKHVLRGAADAMERR